MAELIELMVIVRDYLIGKLIRNRVFELNRAYAKMKREVGIY